MLGLLNLKTIGIAGAFLVMAVSFSFWKGCDYGTERTVKEYRAKLDESELKYQRLLNAPPKIETRTVTVYVKAKPTSGTAEASPLESEEENPLAIPKTTTIHINAPGELAVTFYPLELPVKQFQWYLEPEPMKVDTVYVTVTKTAVEYVDVNVFEKVEFYIGAVIAGVVGYAVAGGF